MNTFYHHPILILILYTRNNNSLIAFFNILQLHRRCLIFGQSQLSFCDHMTGRYQSFPILLKIFHIQQPFPFCISLSKVKFQYRSCSRSDLQFFHSSATHYLPVFQHLPFQSISRQITEKVFIVHIDFPFREIASGSPNILIKIPHLIHMRIRFTVRTNQSIITEIIVACIKTVKITSICINHLSVFTGPSTRLIHEVPDKSSLQLRILTKQIPILLKSSLRVTHSMSIFTLNQRLLILIICCIFFTPFITSIHRTINISLSRCTSLFILYHTARIFSLNPIVSSFKIRAISSFITQ